MSLRCEILSTGDEVLTGAVLDSNAAYLAEQMGALGFDVARHTTVGDDREALVASFRALGASADIVLCTGGLGPTVDDLTAEVAAQVLGCSLKLDEPALANMLARWKARGQAMPENNRKQAMIPEGADVLPNPVGTAPGFSVRIGRASFFFMPGVPREMTRMFSEQVVPRIERLRPEPTVFQVRVFRSFGLSESAADEALAGLETRFPEVKLGFRTHFPEIQIKLTVKGADVRGTQARLQAASADVTARVGSHIFSTSAPLEQVVGDALREAKATLATAESCTGGLIAQMVTAVPGSSDYFDRAMVTYSNQAKMDLLGVSEAILRQHGAVSEPCVRAMADGARLRAGTTYALAVSGIAGPTGGTPEKPVGLVYVGLSAPDTTLVRRIRWVGDRDQVRAMSAMVALDMLRRRLFGLPLNETDIATERVLT